MLRSDRAKLLYLLLQGYVFEKGRWERMR